MLIAGTVILIGIFIFRLNEQSMPIVLLDEFGYWSNAAFFEGRDWSSIATHNSYYSYGYSLILTLLLKMSHGYEVYKLALLFNLIISVLMLLIHFRIVTMLFPDLDSVIAAIISVIVQLYPSNASNLHIAWAELPLAFFFSLNVLLLLLFYKNKNQIYLYLWIVISFFEYTLHQRALGVLLVAILLSFFMVIKKEIKCTQLFAVYGLLIALYALHHYIKALLLNNVVIREQNVMSNVNDYPSIYQHIINNLNLSGLKSFVISASGKAAYLIIISLGTIILLLSKIIRETIQNKARAAIYVYLIAVSFFELCIISIFTMGGNRLDNIIYGRYLEWFSQPLILIGFTCAIHENPQKTLLKGALTVSIACLIVKIIYTITNASDDYIYVCSPAVFPFYKLVPNKDFILFLGIILSGFLICLTMLQQKKQLLCLAVVFLFGSIYLDIVCVNRVLASNYRSEIIKEIANEIDNKAYEVYYINDDSQLIWYVADLQVYKNNLTIKELSISEKYELPHDCYILLNPYYKEGMNFIKHKHNEEPLISNWQVALYKISSTEN